MATNRQNTSNGPPGMNSMTPAAISSERIQHALAGSSTDLTPVRRSTRESKRKKFDDEVIDVGVSTKLSKKPRPSISETKPLALPASKPAGQLGSTPPLVQDIDKSDQVESIPVASPITSTTNNAPQQQLSPKIPIAPLIDASTATSTVAPASGSRMEMETYEQPLVSPPPRPKLISPPPPAPYAQQQQSKSKKNRASKKNSAASAVVPSNVQLLEQTCALKDIGRWQAIDDLALITAVMQTSDLKAIYTGVKFTCKFTLQEVAERWYALLYDQMISKLAQEAMKQLPPDVALAVQSNTLFSKAEERVLLSLPSTASPPIDLFNELMIKHSDVFHPARTSRSLYQHWLHMRQYRVLADQKAVPLPQGDYVMTFSDLEENFSESDVPLVDPLTERELVLAERHLTKQIRQLENELPKWHVLVECATGVATPDFDQNTVAVLRGRLVRYLMRSKEVTLGRNAKGYQVDIDLSLEGPAFKVSRKQATIRLRPNGDFYMVNEGKRPMYIDGKPVLPGSKSKLNNNSVIEIACLRLLFLTNQEVINQFVREEESKGIVS